MSSSDARAQGDATADVTLEREAPFKAWCVAPLCKRDTPKHAAFVKVPSAIAPNSTDGFMEQRVKRALTDALEAAAKATLGPAYNRAVADVAEAAAATAIADRERLDKVGGLAAAVVRAALAYHMDAIVPQDAACVAPRRIDAIYEGLALSVALAPLEFPQKTRRVPASCAETAKATARAIDRAVLHTVVSDELRGRVEATVAAIEATKKSCAAVPSTAELTFARAKDASTVTSAATIDGAAKALEAFAKMPLRQPTEAPSLDPSAPQNALPSDEEKACNAALDALGALPVTPLQAIAREGLAEAELAPLVASLRTAPDELGVVLKIARGATNGDELRALVRTLVEALARGVGLPVDAPVLKDVIDTLPKAVVVDGGNATIDPNVILAFLAERYGVGDDGRPTLKSLLGLGATPFVFELNGGLPNVDFSQQLIVADATIGYSTKKFGIIGRGWIDNYSIDDPQTHNDYTHAGGHLEGWWLSGDGTNKLRLELRLTGGFDYYDTTTYPFKDPLQSYYDFDSRIERATLFAGIRYGSPVDRFGLQLIVGGGGQHEDPNVQTFVKGGRVPSLQVTEVWSGQAMGRLNAHVRIVPGIVGLRLRSEAIYFTLTRQQVSYLSTAMTTAAPEQQQQIEIHSRAFLDADVAALFGFVPALFAGVDYLGISGSQTQSSTAIPLAGAGIVRRAW